MAQIAEGNEAERGDGRMDVTRKSVFSGKVRTVSLAVTPQQFARWRSGALIQEAFPNLTASEREFLLTGATAEEWATFAQDEDEQ